ncbi:MAG: plectin, partial [Oscillospiraceae bacterium]|nr:plectin [Oscillospiraceae bacterium]
MNESRFIRTVTFGGYDKTDVDKKLESLYTQIFDLKNELRETKLLIEEFKKGTDEEKAQEAVIAGERAMLTSAQVQKETLSDKVKLLDDDNKTKDKEIAALTEQVSAMKTQLDEANSRLTVFEAGTDAASLGTVFIEAQKAANTVIEASKSKADELEKNTNKLVENMVDDANNKAAKIIYEAEKRAAEMDAESKNNAEKMNAASENLRAVILKEVEGYSAQIAKLREVFTNFEDLGIAKIQESESLLDRTKKRLTEGGVPVFRDPA